MNYLNKYGWKTFVVRLISGTLILIAFCLFVWGLSSFAKTLPTTSYKCLEGVYYECKGINGNYTCLDQNIKCYEVKNGD